MTNLQIYNEIIEKRGLKELPYQKEFLTTDYTSDKPFVLGAGTSSGKTFMAIMKLEIFYSYSQNKNKRTLIIPYSMKVLRDNFEKELGTFNPSFSYCVATTKEELVDCLKSDYQVVVALPQSLSNVSNLLPHFHNFVLDEAHRWYFAKTITDIVKTIKPKYQLLLTGTPSKFIMKGDKFNFQLVPVMDLFDLNQVTDVRLEVVSSTYDFKQSDYNGTYGNLKSGKITKKDTDESLTMVCKEMLKRIKNPIKQPNISRVTKNVLSVFNQIGKTIIFCHSKSQANAIYKSLNSFSELTGKVLVSHSENDTDSEGFIKFKDSDEYSVLVAVDRGKLGYNIEELFNVVDFTLTQSLDMLMQMYGRLLRLSTTNKPKTYYKVATKNTASYYMELMLGMMCLTHIDWYSKYNGKNMDGILIPRILTTSKTKSKLPNKHVSSKSSKTVKPNVNIAQLGIPLDLKLFKSVYHTDNDKFGPIGYTTLGDCRREFYGMRTRWNINDKDYINEIALKYNKKVDFQTNNNAEYLAAKRLGIIDEVCSHMDLLKIKIWSEDEVRQEALKYKTKKEFRENNSKAYGFAKRLGIFNEVCSHMNILKKSWTKEMIKEEALKYNTKEEFRKNSNVAYTNASRLNILPEICFHMKGKTYWNETLVREVASKYKTKKEFRENNKNAFLYASKKNLLNKLF